MRFFSAPPSDTPRRGFENVPDLMAEPTLIRRYEGSVAFQQTTLVLGEGKKVPESIRQSTAARFWTTVQMPDGTKMSVEDWEKTQIG